MPKPRKANIDKEKRMGQEKGKTNNGMDENKKLIILGILTLITWIGLFVFLYYFYQLYQHFKAAKDDGLLDENLGIRKLSKNLTNENFDIFYNDLLNTSTKIPTLKLSRRAIPKLLTAIENSADTCQEPSSINYTKAFSALSKAIDEMTSQEVSQFCISIPMTNYIKKCDLNPFFQYVKSEIRAGCYYHLDLITEPSFEHPDEVLSLVSNMIVPPMKYNQICQYLSNVEPTEKWNEEMIQNLKERKCHGYEL